MIKNPRSIEFFLQYFNPQSLESNQRISSRVFLRLLYLETKNFWRPTNCRLIDAYTEKANQVDKQNFFSELTIKRYIRSHYFWQTETPKGSFIIDPTGVPIDERTWKIDKNKIIPYFGLQETASGNHKEVYDCAEEFDNWRTRNLPPRFYP